VASRETAGGQEQADRDVRYGIHVPNLWEYGDPRVLADLAVLAEECGWDGFFVWDHVLFGLDDPPHVCDPWIALAAAAARTRRIRLGAMVTPLPRRRPWKLAREVASLDLLSGGRVVFGAGLGSPPDAEFAVYGEDPDARVRRGKLDEGLELLRLFWSGAPVRFSGEHFTVDGATFLPTPVQQPVPIWVGGNWPSKPPFRRAARVNGVMPERGGGELLSPSDLTDALAFIAQEKERQGIDPDGRYDVVTAGYTPLGDSSAARDVVAPYVAAGATWWIERFLPSRGPLEWTREHVRQGPPRA
jgi:alkanesulfonate monooxygenase SsuD/methylene tetrahydromethanopterin reductase-like flavin-dependent oxidoreductase (luciferase family)